jgi:hypothetical protein
MNDLETLTGFAKGYAEAWCSQKPEAVAAFFAENGSLSVNDGPPAVGRAAIAEVARGFMRDFPDMIVTMDEVTSDSDGVKFHWTLIGTNTGPGGTGKRVCISGYELWKIGNDGLIAEKAISTATNTSASSSTESMANVGSFMNWRNRRRLWPRRVWTRYRPYHRCAPRFRRLREQ